MTPSIPPNLKIARITKTGECVCPVCGHAAERDRAGLPQVPATTKLT